MLEAALSALQSFTSPFFFGMLLLGVLIGTLGGVLPGIGGTATLALILPFIFYFDATSAIAVSIGALAVTVTADSITSVLIAVPGGVSSAATILDGHPMAKRGEAGRALSAAFWASAFGGVIGAVLLVLSIPVASYLLKQFSTPEYFMLTVLGVAMASVLTGREPLKGMIAGGLGLLLAAIGTAPATEYVRYSFGILYLYDGLPVVIICLGLFGMPEMVDLMVMGTPIAKSLRLGAGVLQGIKDVLREWWLVVRCSVLGAFVGFLPGMGAGVAAWLAYGHAVQSAKDKSRFGYGDVRGVIAPETANNSARGGELIPTLAFGIPVTSTMAIFMVLLTVFGIYAGPEMITNQLSVFFTIVWSLAIASVIGTVVCTVLVKPLAYVSTTPAYIMAPFVMVVLIVGAYQSTQSWEDLLLLLALGLFGWFMKHFGFSRAALLIGFVLGTFAEKYLALTVQRWGIAWMVRPWVIVIAATIAVSLFAGIRWQSKRALPKREG